ncbi:MAG: hypothetical protein GX595_09625 [Lentisphaerae bacterium]|nr:hypothetical protein [Lentisphaerota bacterium]
MSRWLRRIGVGMIAAGALWGQDRLRFEAEAVSGPAEAWVQERQSDAHWTLWSTDTDAHAKWSGGVVLRAPPTRADRARPEDGAPPLHTRIADLPPGLYTVEVKVSRVLGVSLDGETWQRFTGGVLMPSRQIAAGEVLEFWVDDRYAMPEEAQRGSGYYDYVELVRLRSWSDGVPNAGFEETDAGGLPAGWAWWSRDGRGTISAQAGSGHDGQRAIHVIYDGTADWAVTNAARLAVAAGTDLCLSGWLRGTPGPGAGWVSIDAVGYAQGRLVTWRLGAARGRPTAEWTRVRGFFQVPEDVDTLQVRLTGAGAADVWLDGVALEAGRAVLPVNPPVDGWARERHPEPMGRGAVALPLPDGTVRLSWRLLQADPADVGFEVWRQLGAAPAVRLNTTPITATTEFLDDPPDDAPRPRYRIRPSAGGGPEGEAVWADLEGDTPCLRIPLDTPTTRFQKVAVADLDGDGAYDYVIKHPHENIDPWEKYWYRSPDTYKLDAYRSDGTLLWRQDLGWAIERGIWYSPYLAWDLTGDGRAEVAAKVGTGDPRDPDGRVTRGDEFVAVWDGRTGQEIARAPWPGREGFESYNLTSRNQIAVAYLDGRTPCLLLLRGTYSRMVVHAYQLHRGRLEKLWEYDNADLGAAYWGQGAHMTLAADVDGDGRDEVLLGNAVLDDHGGPLWTTGRGHPDAFYLADIIPDHPGLEIAYVMEVRQPSGGLNVVEARTGKTLWKLPEATQHVHGKGMAADIDPTRPGLEIYGADADGHTLTEKRWLLDCHGEVLRQGTDCPWGFSIGTVYWDADLQKELLGGRITDYQGGPVGGSCRGSVVLKADVVGDWREEIIVSVPGELRILCTPIAAVDRRVCLMQDPLYRLATAVNAMGYTQPPTLSVNLETLSPNLNLTVLDSPDGATTARVVISAPAASGIRGRLVLEPGDGLQVDPASADVAVAPGQRQVVMVRLTASGAKRLEARLGARVEQPDGPTLRGEVPVAMAGAFLTEGLIVQAEDLAAEEGGAIQIRSDKPGVMGRAISHWDAAGHALTWRVSVPTAGRYRLVLRYCTPETVRRALRIDDRDIGVVRLAATGSFGTSPHDWDHTTAATDQGTVTLDLTAGDHTLRLENRDGKGCNLDYLALLPEP